MKKENQCLITCSVIHLLIDLSCAWLMISRISTMDWWYPSLFLYNFLAFALQMPLGVIVDAQNRESLFASLGCLVTAFALLPIFSAPAAIIFAGCGNALFHVGGGAYILRSSKGTCSRPGIFVSTGAIGLFAGRFLALKVSLGFISAAIFFLLLFSGILIFCILPGRKSLCTSAQQLQDLQHSGTCLKIDPQNSPTHVERTSPVLDFKSGLKIFLCLFAVVCLRSYQGMVLSFSWNTGLVTAFTLVTVTALGKCLGGICADRFGFLKTSIMSLLTAACLFLLPFWITAGLTAVLCFNMTMPITLTALYRLMPQRPGFAFGLLTFALFLGFLPVYFGYIPLNGNCPLSSLLSLLSLFLLWNGLALQRTQ